MCSRRGSSETKTTEQPVSQRQFTHGKPDVRQRVGHTSRAVSDDSSSSSVTGASVCCRLDFRLALRTRSQARLSSCFTCSMAAQSAVSSKSTRGGTTEGPHEVCIWRPHLSQWKIKLRCVTDAQTLQLFNVCGLMRMMKTNRREFAIF